VTLSSPSASLALGLIDRAVEGRLQAVAVVVVLEGGAAGKGGVGDESDAVLGQRRAVLDDFDILVTTAALPSRGNAGGLTHHVGNERDGRRGRLDG
jgi:hypothetical protein